MDEKHYSDYYNTDFGQKILQKEVGFIDKELNGCRKILSIGCGPAILEARLVELSPTITLMGLDKSREMLTQAQKSSNVVLGDAENMCFKERSIDCVYYLTSLEFIDEYEKAIEETVRVLKSKGLCLFLILNPESRFFQEKYNEEHSYIHKNIKHTDIEKLKAFISIYFSVESRYFLGINDRKIIDTDDKEYASLYAIKGIKVF
jgi:ubiquinone/menaquinone biosynthesis C-methylase UbiE